VDLPSQQRAMLSLCVGSHSRQQFPCSLEQPVSCFPTLASQESLSCISSFASEYPFCSSIAGRCGPTNSSSLLKMVGESSFSGLILKRERLCHWALPYVLIYGRLTSSYSDFVDMTHSALTEGVGWKSSTFTNLAGATNQGRLARLGTT
jgi:hypothetical protein